LSGANTFGGGLTVNNGVIRLNAANNGGTGTITANTGGTVVFGAAQTNSGIILAGGTFGVSVTQNPLVDDLTAAASTSSTLYIADPQNLAATDAIETVFTGTWHGSGNVIVATVTNDLGGPDNGNGFRLRGTAASDFSGTLILSNNVKGEVQTTVAGPFSPAGTGKIVLTCGTYFGGNSTNASPIGGYCELNLRNNSSGNTTFGNNIELAGAGLAVLNPLGTAPAGNTTTMGNLKMGGGQELALYLNSQPYHVIVFPTVTLTGGTATFYPKSPTFGSTGSAGSELSLGDISELAPSSIVMYGVSNLFITGTCTYSGSTTVSNGFLNISGALNGGGALNVWGGTLKGNGSTTGNVTVNSAGTISPGASVGKFTSSGAVTLSGTNVMEIDKTAGTNDVLQGSSIAYGGTLSLSLLSGSYAAGDSFKLYNASSYSGSFSAIVPTIPGTDLLWDTSGLTNGTLKVLSAVVPQPGITNVALYGSDLVISGTNGTTSGNYYVLASTNIALPVTNWDRIATNSFVSGNFNFTNTVDPAIPTRFFILQMP